MYSYACKQCSKALTPKETNCPHCGIEDPHRRCRNCNEIAPMVVPKCPSCKTKAPLMSKRAAFLRAYILPALIVASFSLLILLKR